MRLPISAVLILTACSTNFPAPPVAQGDAAPPLVDADPPDPAPDIDPDGAPDLLDAAPPPPPAPEPGELVINEVDYDQDGDDRAEFVEVLSVADGPRSVDGLVIELLGSNGQPYLMRALDGPAALEPGERLLLTGGRRPDLVPEQTQMRPAFGGSENRIRNQMSAVRLLNPAGAIVDTVGYGGSEVAEGASATAADDGDPPRGSLGRCPDGTDSNDNNSDLLHNPEPTPGLPNRCP